LGQTSFVDSITFPALDWLAQLTTHIPDKREHTVRYYGYYSNKSRGLRKKAGTDNDIPAVDSFFTTKQVLPSSFLPFPSNFSEPLKQHTTYRIQKRLTHNQLSHILFLSKSKVLFLFTTVGACLNHAIGLLSFRRPCCADKRFSRVAGRIDRKILQRE
jgi:hypothetical protein